MNKIKGMMITMLLSVAIVLVAPQVFAATFDFLTAAPTEINTGFPGEGEKYPSEPTVVCSVDRGNPGVMDLAQMDYYHEREEPKSTCSGAGSDIPSHDVDRMGAPEHWHY